MPKFYPGQPVVCVNDNFRRSRVIYPGVTWPRRGVKYRVRCYVVSGVAYPALVLHEIHNKRVPYMDGVMREAGFWDERFEPATKKVVSELLSVKAPAPVRVRHEEDA